jgi:hypothetical protein
MQLMLRLCSCFAADFLLLFLLQEYCDLGTLHHVVRLVRFNAYVLSCSLCLQSFALDAVSTAGVL